MHVGSFWIDPEITSNQSSLKGILAELYPGAQENEHEGGATTLHVATVDNVKNRYNSKLLFVADECLKEIKSKGINPRDFLRDGHQYISTCLANVNITSTGFEIEDLRVLVKEIGMLGGNFERSLTKDTYALVAATTASHKVYSAAEISVPVVTTEWVHACFDSRVHIPLNEYRMPSFFGCKFSSTDLTMKQKKDISKLVKNGGGVWSDSYDETVTYLVSHRLTSSRKILLALAANVPIVVPEWVMKTSNSLISPTPYTLNWWCFQKTKLHFFRGMSFELSKQIASVESLSEAIIESGGSIESPAKYYVTVDLTDTSSGIPVSPRWVWRCVSEKAFIPIDDSLTYKPFPFKTPLMELNGKAISVINFPDDVRLDIADALRNLGLNVYYSFSRNASVVIMQSPDAKTIQNAQEYGIPVVGLAWFVELMKTGQVPDASSFTVSLAKDHVNIDSLCKNLRRTNSKQQETDCDGTKVDLHQLDSFTQMSPGSDRATSANAIGYDTTDVALQLDTTKDGNDPLLSAFGD